MVYFYRFIMDIERLKKQIDFILEADNEKKIFRQTHITNNERRENDAEHAWHMAIMVYLLKEYSNNKIDLAKTMLMALIHDIVEIDAGDTYAYDENAVKTQAEREKKAADRIFNLLPTDQAKELREIFDEFEENNTPEANFAHAMDNFQPLLLNHSNDGNDWREHNVKRSQVVKRQEKSKKGSMPIWEYSQKLIDENFSKGNLKDEK